MARALPCAVTILVRLRRPDAHYLSFFRWAAAGSRKFLGLARGLNTSETTSDMFLRWMPRNLQSHILYHEHAQTLAQVGGRREEGGGR